MLTVWRRPTQAGLDVQNRHRLRSPDQRCPAHQSVIEQSRLLKRLVNSANHHGSVQPTEEGESRVTERSPEIQASVGTAAENGDVTATVQLDPWFRLAAASYDATRGGTLVLTCTDAVTPDPASVAVSAAPGTGAGVPITAATAGPTITVTVPGGAAPGRYEVTANDSANATHRARRTILVT